MEAQFESSFRRYAERACNRLGSYSTTQREETTLRILPNRTSLLRSSVDELEAHSAFSQLVSDVHETFSGTEFRRSLSGWQRSIGNFLRRSGFYSEIFEGSSIDIGSFFKLLVASVRRKEHTVRYFVPLEFVDFSRPTIEFGTSSIQRFSTDRLSEIFQLKTNEAFFPWAFFDIEQLAYYWFLCVEEKIPARNPEVLEFDLSGIERVDIQYASLPSPVVAAVHRLVLFSWQASFWGGAADVVDAAETDKGRGWMGFGIPFVMKCDDNLLASPSVVPNLSGLATEPVFDPRTDEEVGEKPAIYIYLDEQETETFEIFINRIDSMIEGLPLKQKNCRFLDIAFGNLTKGFFAEGLDQLLWHIVTLEALVGEDREGLGTIIARRVAATGSTKKERKNIGEQFRDLYEFRSRLVHGSSIKKEAFLSHLRIGREMARRVLLWFVHYLSTVELRESAYDNPGLVPRREDILALLDLEEDERGRLRNLMDSLPISFPFKDEWI